MVKSEIFKDLKLLHGLFEAFILNNIDDECVEYEAEQVHGIVERMLTILEQYDFEYEKMSGGDSE